MRRDPRFDVLFEPVRIGPVVARNRFFQVPHCNGMGHRDPTALAAMRAVKAEGGWAVVCTEEVEIHPSAEITPFIELRLWDDRDIPALARMAEAVHAHGALAGVELCDNGLNAPNHYSRMVPRGPSSLPIITFTADPVQARAMDKKDIADLRRRHRQAVRRSIEAGFDLVYVYAAHNLGILEHFLSRRYNHRSDEYGGSLENRVRLLREVIEDAKEEAGDAAAIAVRLSVGQFLGEGELTRGEVETIVEMLAELPDLWDFCLAGWEMDSRTSRFAEEGAQEEYLRGLRRLTTKPVVGVGRYTSPDAMVRLVREGLVDFIGAARPSIADPFLPRKIEEGRIEEIRECIGCNICVSGDFTMAPIRCTQNAAMGEEWRRGWHPERIRPKETEAPVLVVGAGPAGLECALWLGRRGHPVTLAEAGRDLGGRVLRESRLPGLSAWIRVRDWREGRLAEMPEVEIFRESRLEAGDVLEFAAAHVVLATGSRWRRDGVARFHTLPIPIDEAAEVYTPDDLMEGKRPGDGPVLLYDDDHFYMGGVLAELLVREGFEVALVTPAAEVSSWTRNTLEQHAIQKRLMELGVELVTGRAVAAIAAGKTELVCVHTGRRRWREAAAVVLVTARLPEEGLLRDLEARRAEWADRGITTVTAIGDAEAPATIAHAVYAGRRFAEELGARIDPDAVPFRRELPELLPWRAEGRRGTGG